MRIIGILLPLMLSLSFLACDKEEEPWNKEIITLECLEGTWNLAYTSGGILGGGYTANFNKLEIDSDSKFELTNLDQVIAKGEIVEIEHEYFDFYIKLITSELNIDKYVDILDDYGKGVTFEENEMRFISGIFDGFNTGFEKE